MHPVIPLERPKERRVPKHELIVFNLKTNPGDTNSTVYEMNIPIYKDGASPEELLMLLRSMETVFTDQPVPDVNSKFRTMRRVLHGGMLTAFEKSLKDAGSDERDAKTYKRSINGLIAHVFGNEALFDQRNALKRCPSFKKPKDMKMKDYVARMNEINSYLSKFPTPDKSNKFSPGELAEIIEYNLPPKWRKKMKEMSRDSSSKKRPLTLKELDEIGTKLETLNISHSPLLTPSLQPRKSKNDWDFKIPRKKKQKAFDDDDEDDRYDYERKERHYGYEDSYKTPPTRVSYARKPPARSHRHKRGPRKSYREYHREERRYNKRHGRGHMYSEEELNAIVMKESERVRRSLLSKARHWKHNKDALEARRKAGEEVRAYDSISDVEIDDIDDEVLVIDDPKASKVSQESDNCSLSPADQKILDELDLSDGELIDAMDEHD